MSRKPKYTQEERNSIPTISGYFNQLDHGPTKGYTEDGPVQWVKKERLKNNEDAKDKAHFEKLMRDDNAYQAPTNKP